MKSLKLLLSVAFVFGLAQALQADVTLEKTSNSVVVTIDQKPFSEFRFGNDLPKPYMWPVRGSDGTVLTRPILKDAKGGDHPHHKGIWVAVDEVGGIKFWAEAGKIKTQSVDVVKASGNPAQFKVVNHWVNQDGEPVVIESTSISIFANRLLAYDIQFTANPKSPVPFGDTKEGLFGFRMVDSMREKVGGIVTNAEGGVGTKDCWGKTSEWVDYVGPVEGKTFGVAIFDHPLNFRPSRYHVRDYGLFSVSPFGEKAYTNGKQPEALDVLAPGASLRLRYGLYIHDGDAVQGRVAETYKRYLIGG
jgi:hypothetical protein